MTSCQTTIDWVSIAAEVDKHGYMSGSDRMSDRVKETGEVFTPTHIVIHMLKKADINDYGPGKTVIDPACGDGQILVTAFWLKVIHFGMTHEDALKDIYGIDLMEDNVNLCKDRLDPHHEFRDILDRNIVCADGLRYHYRFDGSHPYDDETSEEEDKKHFDSFFEIES